MIGVKNKPGLACQSVSRKAILISLLEIMKKANYVEGGREPFPRWNGKDIIDNLKKCAISVGDA